MPAENTRPISDEEREQLRPLVTMMQPLDPARPAPQFGDRRSPRRDLGTLAIPAGVIPVLAGDGQLLAVVHREANGTMTMKPAPGGAHPAGCGYCGASTEEFEAAGCGVKDCQMHVQLSAAEQSLASPPTELEFAALCDELIYVTAKASHEGKLPNSPALGAIDDAYRLALKTIADLRAENTRLSAVGMCGNEMPALFPVGAARIFCDLTAGHIGWHEDRDHGGTWGGYARVAAQVAATAPDAYWSTNAAALPTSGTQDGQFDGHGRRGDGL